MTHPAARVGRLLTILVLVAACAGPALVLSPEPSQEAAASASGQPQPSVGVSPGLGQTDTSWGRIWDDVPDTFPLFPGAAPAESPSEAVSAALAIEGADPREVASWMQSQLDSSFTTEGFNGPLEDGGFVLDSVAAGGCRIQVTAAPLGSLTSLIVRYGAECPPP